MKWAFVFHQIRKEKDRIVIHYVAVDTRGRAWWWDSDQPNEEWKPLPPHPEFKA